MDTSTLWHMWLIYMDHSANKRPRACILPFWFHPDLFVIHCWQQHLKTKCSTWWSLLVAITSKWNKKHVEKMIFVSHRLLGKGSVTPPLIFPNTSNNVLNDWNKIWICTNQIYHWPGRGQIFCKIGFTLFRKLHHVRRKRFLSLE